MVKFSTNTSGTTYNWPNLEPTQVALFLAGEITQVKESIPRCASGNDWNTVLNSKRSRNMGLLYNNHVKIGVLSSVPDGKMEDLFLAKKWI